MGKKIRTGISINCELLADCDRYLKGCDCSNRSELIEQALRFYLATREVEQCSDLLVPEPAECIAASSDKGITKISKGLFRYAVEVELLILLTAEVLDVQGKDLRALRRQAIENVRQARGRVDLDELCRWHSREKGRNES